MNYEDLNDDISNDDFISVPLPDQVPLTSVSAPSPHEFSNIAPAPQEISVNRSRTVQTLLTQNQDLTARLTVALKQNIELEQKIENQDDNYQKISTQYDLLRNQMSLVQEKNKRIDFDNQKLVDQNSGLEKRFAELYTAYQDKIGHIQKISYRLHRYLNYRKRIRGIAKPFITNLKAQILNLKEELLNTNQKVLKQNETIAELKQRLGEAVEHIQAVTLKFEKDQSDLVSYHENRFQQISAEQAALKGYAENLEAQNADLNKTVEEYKENEVGLQNKSIFFERKYTDLKNEFEQISKAFIDQKTSDNGRLTTLEIQLKETSSSYSTTLDLKNKLETENKALNDQYQSLQLLYRDGSEKMDEFKRMSLAQDQINKELSQSLVEQRKKAEFLEQKLIEAEEEFKRKLQSFQVRFQRQDSNVATLTPVNPPGQKELLSKIQNLLTEIQTGHGNELDFKESGVAPETKSPVQGDQLMSEFGDIEKS